MKLRGRDLIFFVGAPLLSVLGVLALSSLAPFAEARAGLGVAAGWGLALAVMLPGHLLNAAALASNDPRRLQRSVLLGSALRLLGSGVGMLLFAGLVSEAPMTAFLLSFLAGYFVLAVLELLLSVGHPLRSVSA